MPPTVRSRLATVPRRRRLRAVFRRVRALRHHVAAVLREFRASILGFLLVTVGGGWLYGELYALARPGEPGIPFIDRPYIMVQLMVLEAPERVPAEWYLVAFWYALPAVFIILLGLGAADFVDLFFNRDDERDAWSEAVAMTYRQHTVVLGAGHVGLRVVRDLHDMGVEVVVVDQEPGPDAREVLERLGVPVVRGDGRRPATLERARIGDATAFVACTADDQVNLQAAGRARNASPDLRIVARMWDVELADHMVETGQVDQVLSAADLSAPAFAGAAAGLEITQTLAVGGTEYSTVRMGVAPGSFLDGVAVGELEARESMEIVLHCRGSVTEVDPDPEVTVQAGDDVVIFAPHQRILDMVSRNRRR
ncbi:MAG: NAD-binding protein [Gemmatimonadota bacterium]